MFLLTLKEETTKKKYISVIQFEMLLNDLRCTNYFNSREKQVGKSRNNPPSLKMDMKANNKIE